MCRQTSMLDSDSVVIQRGINTTRDMCQIIACTVRFSESKSFVSYKLPATQVR